MELAVLTGSGQRKVLEDKNLPDVVNCFLDGKFEELLGGERGRQILGENSADHGDLRKCIVDNVERFVSGSAEERELEVLVTGAACLQLFVQINWLGPPTQTPAINFLPQPFKDSKELQENALADLSEDGEPVYNLSRCIVYLQIARIIFTDCKHLVSSLQTWDWWLARCMIVQQFLLEQRSPTLRDAILHTLEEVSKRESLIHDDANRDVAVLFHIEASQMCQYYWEDRLARDHVRQAQKLAGIIVELTGALGKRTRYQQEHKAQLVVRVTRDEDVQPLPPVGLCDPEFSAPVPKSLLLDDDTVLNEINFKDDETSSVTQLSPLEQALLFVVMESHRRALAEERLTNEEIMTYLEHIIAHVSSWSVSVSAHFLRSRLQKDSRRRVERSMQQLEELSNQTQRPEPGAHVRLLLFYAARPQTIWNIQGELAAVLISLGCFGEALTLYERLHLWEDAIACYKHMGKMMQAETVIREQLKLKKTPTLLCFLGDVTRKQTYYEEAWTLSNGRSARAMRCLGYIHFNEQKYEEAIQCFNKSLEINSLQVPVWFTCGCACLSAEQYEAAIRAFKRCVSIDYDNFEAWSNLAAAYAKLNKKKEAFVTVKDALKCSFDNWRLWENCLVFATDCGEFNEVIQAYHRLLDLKEQYTDAEVLGIVVKAVVTNLEDAKGQPAGRLHSKLLELFGRITSKVTTEAEIWRLYSELCRAQTDYNNADLVKAVQYLQKSHRCLVQKNDWEKSLQQCEIVAQRALELADLYKLCVSEMGKSQQAIEMMNSAKFMLKGAVGRIRQQHTDPVTKELVESLNSKCQALDQELQTVMDKLTELRG